MSVVRVFVPSNLGLRNLWRHSIGTGVAAFHIAKHDETFTLVKDLGLLLIVLKGTKLRDRKGELDKQNIALG